MDSQGTQFTRSSSRSRPSTASWTTVPKTVDEIEFDTTGDRARCVWDKDGQNVLKISMPIGGRRDFPEQMLSTYSYIDGVLHETRFASSAANLGVRMGGVRLALGAHPIADELRARGLNRDSW